MCDLILRGLLYHVFRDSIDLLTRLQIRNGVEIDAAIALQQLGADPFQLLAILTRRRIVLGPNQVKHLLETDL